jgi:hypothetical protein
MNIMKFSYIVLVFFWFVGACYAQSAGAGPSASAAGNGLHKRFVSDKGRFSIEFIKEPTYEVQQFGETTVHEFKVSEGKTEWRLTYTDFQTEVNDEDSLRAAYRTAIESLRTRPATLVRKTEIRLNGKLGVEDLMSDGEITYTTRCFLIGRRLYLVSVKEQRAARRSAAKAVSSPRVQRFLDSFDFWELAKPQQTGN